MSGAPGATTLVTTPTFGRFSDEPWRILRQAGEVLRPPEAHPMPEVDLRTRITGVEALVVGLDTVTADLIATADRLRVIAKHGVGVDAIDLDTARENGIRVVCAPGSNSRAVAELAFGLLLAAARRIVHTHVEVVDGGWPKHFGPELAGKTLAVVGFGRIGRLVAGYAQAFGMRVVATDPHLEPAEIAAHGVEPLDLPDSLARADFVSLHLPGQPDDTALLDRAALSAMRPGACLVNTARGGLVDEVALAELLRSGHLGAAAVDAFAGEPLGDSPLRTAPNAILTSHIGACSREANRTMGVMVAEDIVRVLAGDAPRNAVV